MVGTSAPCASAPVLPTNEADQDLVSRIVRENMPKANKTYPLSTVMTESDRDDEDCARVGEIPTSMLSPGDIATARAAGRLRVTTRGLGFVTMPEAEQDSPNFTPRDLKEFEARGWTRINNPRSSEARTLGKNWDVSPRCLFVERGEHGCRNDEPSRCCPECMSWNHGEPRRESAPLTRDEEQAAEDYVALDASEDKASVPVERDASLLAIKEAAWSFLGYAKAAVTACDPEWEPKYDAALAELERAIAADVLARDAALSVGQEGTKR